MKRINSKGGGGSLEKNFKPLAGFIRLRGLEVGATIAGTYKARKEFGKDYPKDFHLIELAQSLAYTNKEGEQSASAGDVVALETTTVLSRDLTDNLIGQDITIVYEGRGAAKKGQRPPYLVGIYEGLPESAEAVVEASVAKATGTTGAPARSGFPFTKK